MEKIEKKNKKKRIRAITTSKKIQRWTYTYMKFPKNKDNNINIVIPKPH